MNQILKSLRASKGISRTVNTINRNGQVDWRSWDAKHTDEALNLFIRKGLCKKINNTKLQYSAFIVSFSKVERNIIKILDMAIDRSNGLKDFLITHSIFDTNANKKGDWLQRYMVNKLFPTDKEVYNLFHPECIPKELLHKIRIFCPVQVIFEIDPIKIQYGMWRRDDNGRVLDPINIIHTDFNVVKQEDIRKEIAQYDCIESDPVLVNEDWLMEDDDLPF